MGFKCIYPCFYCHSNKELSGFILDLIRLWIQYPTSDLVTLDTFSASNRITYERLKRRQICYFLLKGGFLTLQSSSILPSSLSSSLPLVFCVQDHDKNIRDIGAFSTFSSRDASHQVFTPSTLQSSCIDEAGPVQSPSAHRCHKSAQQNNGLDTVKSGEICVKPAKVK